MAKFINKKGDSGMASLDLFSEIAELKTQVEKLKCCGNCQHIYESISGDYCRINLDDDGRRTSTSPSTKCMNWESGK